ncbi:hypothetical protein [Luedemannella flava]|uniref:hypothetical protein n=1 Tax=Luedemannella flava TaxID=349316 RepID=UPI0031D66DA9
MGAFLLVVLAVVATLTGPATSGSESLTLAWRSTAFHTFFGVTDDTVYAVTDDAGQLRLVARSLDRGLIRWSLRIEGPLADAYYASAVNVVTRFPPSPGTPAATRVATQEAGRRLVAYPVAAVPLAYIAGTVAIMIDREPSTTSAEIDAREDGWVQAHRVTAVDLASGETRWVGRIEPGSTWALPGVQPWDDGVVVGGPDARQMVVVAPDGSAQSWDLTNGKVVARANIGPYQDFSYALAFPSVLAVSTWSLNGPIVTGWDMRRLAVKWQVPVPNVVAWPAPCGRLLCMTAEDHTWAIDARTGEIVWDAPGVALHPTDVVTRRLSALAGTAPVTLDAATGQAYDIEGGWRVVDSDQRGSELVSVLVSNDGEARLGMLGLGTGTVRDLGQVGSVLAGIRCRANDTHIVCADGGQLRSWRLRG